MKCSDCHHQYFLAFSFRGRWFCPNYHNKKGVQFSYRLTFAPLVFH
ncbi:MAG: hypothetical protein D6B25_11275 [Desulfobulbaceae bacterium]|nr:MAG: hypothetical protein D6B25_11275 [Desulfobulbaceae bacterium]